MSRTLLCLCVLFSACGKKAARTGDDQTPDVAPVQAQGIAPVAPLAGGPKKEALVRPALPAGWGEFKQPDGAFSVYLPGAPQPGATVNDLLQPVPAGRALLAQYKCQGPGWLCDVGVMIYSPELVDGVKSASESRPLPSGLTRTAVTWVGHPATEIVSDDSTKKVEIQRRMWIGNRAYHCNVWGWEPGRPTASELATLFDSFSPAK